MSASGGMIQSELASNGESPAETPGPNLGKEKKMAKSLRMHFPVEITYTARKGNGRAGLYSCQLWNADRKMPYEQIEQNALARAKECAISFGLRFCSLQSVSVESSRDPQGVAS